MWQARMRTHMHECARVRVHLVFCSFVFYVYASDQETCPDTHKETKWKEADRSSHLHLFMKESQTIL